MDTIDPMRFVLASLFVLGLLGMLSVFLKRYGQRGFVGKVGGRVAVVETQFIDQKSKLILVKRDNAEHLLLISEGVTTIIESGIKHDA